LLYFVQLRIAVFAFMLAFRVFVRRFTTISSQEKSRLESIFSLMVRRGRRPDEIQFITYARLAEEEYNHDF
jgi:hypothetical protein